MHIRPFSNALGKEGDIKALERRRDSKEKDRRQKNQGERARAGQAGQGARLEHPKGERFREKDGGG